MKKIFIVLLFILAFQIKTSAESYYFKKCKIDENYSANYIIDINNKKINRTFVNEKTKSVREKTDNIKIVKKDQIVSEIFQSGTNPKLYLQYYLNVKSKTVSIQKYNRNENINFFAPDGPKYRSFCADVKADWDKSGEKSAEEKKQAEFKAKQDRKKLEEKKNRAEELRKQKLKKEKEEENKHEILISGELFAAKKPKKRMESEEQLKIDFRKKAFEICSNSKNYKILEQNIKVMDVGEVTAFPKKGFLAAIKLGIQGIIKCE